MKGHFGDGSPLMSQTTFASHRRAILHFAVEHSTYAADGNVAYPAGMTAFLAI